MPNHYHFVLKCGEDWKEIPAFMHAFMTGYALYYNRRYQKVGRIFQGPFQVRRIIGKRDLNKTIDYIIHNPEGDSIGIDLVESEYKWLFVRDR